MEKKNLCLLTIELPKEDAKKLIELEDFLRHNTDYNLESIIMFFANNKEAVFEVFGGVE